jgi:hypothetical protein
LLAALDERIAKAKGATLRQIIAALAKDELREKSFSTTRDRADAEKRLRERINYQNRQRAKDMAEERMALAAALQKDGLIFGLGPAALATREAASRRDALVAALIGRHEPAE